MYCSFCLFRSFSFCFPFICSFLHCYRCSVLHFIWMLAASPSYTKCKFDEQTASVISDSFSLSRSMCVCLTVFAHILSNTIKHCIPTQSRPLTLCTFAWCTSVHRKTWLYHFALCKQTKQKTDKKWWMKKTLQNRISLHEQVNKYNRYYKYNGMKSSYSLL